MLLADFRRSTRRPGRGGPGRLFVSPRWWSDGRGSPGGPPTSYLVRPPAPNSWLATQNASPIAIAIATPRIPSLLTPILLSLSLRPQYRQQQHTCVGAKILHWKRAPRRPARIPSPLMGMIRLSREWIAPPLEAFPSLAGRHFPERQGSDSALTPQSASLSFPPAFLTLVTIVAWVHRSHQTVRD